MHRWMKGKVGSWKKPRRIADEAGIVFLPGEEAAGKAERSQHYTGNQHFPSIHGARGKGLGLRSCRERHRGHPRVGGPKEVMLVPLSCLHHGPPTCRENDQLPQLAKSRMPFSHPTKSPMTTELPLNLCKKV